MNGILDLKSSHVTYSMNKRKRWLLADQLKSEIQNERICGTGDWVGERKNLHYTPGVTLKRVTSGGVHLCCLAPEQA